jgi:hypothetical protein
MKLPTKDGADIQQRLRAHMDRFEETIGDITVAVDAGGQTLLRGRVKRLEEAVSEIHQAQAQMDQSIRVLSLASLTIKRALVDVVSDLATLPAES